MTKTSKTILWVLVALVIIGGIYFALSYKSAPAEPEVTICTMDARQCPDGSYVGRTGPKCEFVCPGTGTTSANAGVPIVQGNVDANSTVTVFPADTGK